MSRQESDREDLFTEATALKRRVELRVAGFPAEIIAGQRTSGGWSIYFGADPVYHWDEAGGLRRAFVQGKLLRTQGTRLAELTRNRSQPKTWLDRRDLARAETDRLMADMHSVIQRLKQAVAAGEFRIQRTTGEVDFLKVLCTFLEKVGQRRNDPLAPPIPGKR